MQKTASSRWDADLQIHSSFCDQVSTGYAKFVCRKNYVHQLHRTDPTNSVSVQCAWRNHIFDGIFWCINRMIETLISQIERLRNWNEWNESLPIRLETFRIFLWHSFPFVSHPIASHWLLQFARCCRCATKLRTRTSFHVTLLVVYHLFAGLPTAALPSGNGHGRIHRVRLAKCSNDGIPTKEQTKAENSRCEFNLVKIILRAEKCILFVQWAATAPPLQ